MRRSLSDPKLDAETRSLIEAAIEARRSAYAPYSEYAVGAALRTASGELVTGANIENASYGLTVCAERTAIFRWLLEAAHDRGTPFVAIAVAAGPAGEAASGGRPCGACLQVIREFSVDPQVWIVDGESVEELRLSALLPDPFVPPFGPNAPVKES